MWIHESLTRGQMIEVQNMSHMRHTSINRCATSTGSSPVSKSAAYATEILRCHVLEQSAWKRKNPCRVSSVSDDNTCRGTGRSHHTIRSMHVMHRRKFLHRLGGPRLHRPHSEAQCAVTATVYVCLQEALRGVAGQRNKQ